jgi:hypothetical protein
VGVASRDLKDAHPEIVAIYQVVKAVFEKRFPAYELRPFTTYRSPAEQKIEFDAKRSQLDGTIKVGKHNLKPAEAIDIGIFVRKGGAFVDDLVAKGSFSKELRTALYWIVGLLAQRNGARWGGDWDGDGIPVDVDPTERLNDEYHIELRRAS